MHENEKTMSGAYDAYARGDIPALIATWTPDCVWHMKGSTSLAGDYRGSEKILGLLAETVKLSDGTFKLEVEHLFANDKIGVAVCRTKATIAGQTFDSLTTHVHRFVDAKVAESWFLFDDAVAMNGAQAEALKLAAAAV